MKLNTYTYCPRTYGHSQTQYWELRSHLGYRVEPDIYTTEEVMNREREMHKWNMTSDGRKYGWSMIAYRYW